MSSFRNYTFFLGRNRTHRETHRLKVHILGLLLEGLKYKGKCDNQIILTTWPGCLQINKVPQTIDAALVH